METPGGTKDLKSSIKSDKSNFEFKRPPEAPVFYPTKEEFEDPMKFINSVSSEGLKYGIFKIIPPDGWKPPFSLNYDSFKFKPRIQKINELEATTRIKLDFLSKVLKAVAQDGKVPKVPYVEKSLLDLHHLFKIVAREGGPDMVTKKKKWNDVALEMGLTGKTVAQTLRQHYESCLIPYLDSIKGGKGSKEDTETDAELIKLTNIRELKSLEFLGPGPKMPTCNYNFSSSMKTRTRHKKVQYEFDPLAKYMCQACGKDDSEGLLANCRTCYDKYHMVCVTPPLTEQPKDWLCPKCLVACDPSNPYENYGFETAEKEYSLKQFGLMADKFKQNHFKMSGRVVPLDKCEEEYWRLMSCMDSSATVEYGADLSVLDVGSGFPTAENLKIDGCSLEVAEKYSQSKWNLNNLSVLEESALRHIVTNISGMKVPWVYVGMCFSTFCWHNEDHWSYSINYLHWGEPKTWYGVSGLEADKFEREFKSLVPDLFEGNSNILHELVTTMNPNLLMNRGVKICRTDQKEGEFVVTFPRAYHAGFNQGFNFAEACNFAPADWIPMGRKSVIYYSHFKRTCVFSHDELICKIAENPLLVDKDICISAFKDMKDLLFSEMNRRSHIANEVCITKSERFNFSFAKDEDRQCKYCKTTCFLSAIFCPCSKKSLVCLDHSDHLCSCGPSSKILRYHYTFSELVELLLNFIGVIDDANTLSNLVLAVYEYKEAKPFTLCKLVKEAGRKCVSICEYMKEFKKHVALTLRCCIISRFLVQGLVVRKDVKENLSYDSIIFFYKCLKSLPWVIPELKSFESLVENVNKFQNCLNTLQDDDDMTKFQLQSCLKIIKLLNVSFNEVPFLEMKLNELEDVNPPNGSMLTGNTISDNVIGEPCGAQEEADVIDVSSLWQKVTDWNCKVKPILEFGIKTDYTCIVDLVAEGKKLKIDTASMYKLTCLKDEAKDWIEKSTNLLSGEISLYLHEVDEFIKVGKAMPVKLECLTALEKDYLDAKNWIDCARATYCLRDSNQTLLQVLWPRKFKSRSEYIGMQLFEEPLIDSVTFPQDYSQETLKILHEQEYKSLLALRWENCQKTVLPYNNEKIKCACQSDIVFQSITCEMCQTIFHYSCFPRDSEFNKHFVSLPFKKPYCTYCVRTKRPPLSVMEAILKSADKIVLKVPEYHILKYKVHMWNTIQKRVNMFFNLHDVATAFQKIFNYTPKNFNDVPLITLHDRRLFVLKFLLLQIDAFEVLLNYGVKLWSLLEASKSDLSNRVRIPKVAPLDRETIKKKNSNTEVVAPTAAEIKKPTEKKPVNRKRRNSNQQNRPTESAPKKAKNTRKKSGRIPEEFPSSLLERFTVEQLRAYLNEEMCAALCCLKPSEEEVHWVQCDGKCRLWFHMKCVNVVMDEVKDDDDYICLNCMFLDEKSAGGSEAVGGEDVSFPCDP